MLDQCGLEFTLGLGSTSNFLSVLRLWRGVARMDWFVMLDHGFESAFAR
jgi:hypothetical protein